MKQLTEIIDNLTIVSRDYDQLKEIYTDFAKFIEQDNLYKAKLDIKIILNLDAGFFTILFDDRVIDFVFITFLEDEIQKGKVQCYLSKMKGFTSIDKILIDEFTFDFVGVTNIKLPDNNADIDIKNNDDHKRYVIYNIINKSLWQ